MIAADFVSESYWIIVGVAIVAVVWAILVVR
jgi:hypothetical protein